MSCRMADCDPGYKSGAHATLVQSEEIFFGYSCGRSHRLLLQLSEARPVSYSTGPGRRSAGKLGLSRFMNSLLLGLTPPGMHAIDPSYSGGGEVVGSRASVAPACPKYLPSTPEEGEVGWVGAQLTQRTVL
jgi:hypothetical protein